MKRRVFDKAQRGGQVLVTYEPATDTFRVATRPGPEATWGPPLTCIRWDDDAEQAVITDELPQLRNDFIDKLAAWGWGIAEGTTFYDFIAARDALIAAVDRLTATEGATT